MNFIKLLTASIFALALVLFTGCKNDEEISAINVDKEQVNLLLGNKAQVVVSGGKTSECVWKSADENIATVTAFGIIEAVEEGQTDVTVTYGSVTKTVHVTVTDPVVLPARTSSWLFDDPANILKAEIGADLLPGTGTTVPSPTGVTVGFKSIDGPNRPVGNKAVTVEEEYYFQAKHGISVKNGETRINEYTIMIDYRVPKLETWYAFVQTHPTNGDSDAEFFINKSNKIGVGSTGYSADPVVLENVWQRFVVSVKLGPDGWFKYYLDGELIHNVADMSNFGLNIDRFSLDPTYIIFLGDNDGDDGTMDVAEIAVWKEALNDQQVKKMNRLMNKR